MWFRHGLVSLPRKHRSCQQRPMTIQAASASWTIAPPHESGLAEASVVDPANSFQNHRDCQTKPCHLVSNLCFCACNLYIHTTIQHVQERHIESIEVYHVTLMSDNSGGCDHAQDCAPKRMNASPVPKSRSCSSSSSTSKA